MRDSQNLNFAVPARLVAELAQRSGPAGRTVVIVPPDLPDPPAPAPTPTSPIASAPASVKPASSARLARPTDIEYDVQDRLTGIHRKAIYRADAESGDVVSFNDGGWVEKPGGEVVNVSTSVAGEFDLAMPPGGWGHKDLPQQQSWQTKYSSTTSGSRIKMDLRARVVGDAKITVGGREFDTVRIEYRGFTERSASALANGGSQSGAYSADVWYSPKLGRPVRFEVLTRGGVGGGAFYVSEKLELVNIR